MKNWDEVLLILSELRKKNLCVTNFYPNQEEMTIWLKDDKFDFVNIDDKYYYFIHSENKIKYIYFFLQKIEDLEVSLQTISEKYSNCSLVYDFISNNDEISEMLIKINEKLKFDKRLSLKRMSFVDKNLIRQNENDISYADLDDISMLAKLFNDTFDVVTERIPSFSQFETYINNNQILIYRVNQEIAGVAIIEIQKKTMYLKHLLTNPKFRKQGIATKLLNKSFFDAAECFRFILWVKEDNINAINLYSKFGYKDENLRNFTFYKEV